MEEEILQKMWNEIERGIGYGLNTPHDFKCAAKAIATNTGRPISATTLMRIWGYIRDGGTTYQPTRYSLSTLAMMLGYLDVKDFAAYHSNVYHAKTKRTISAK